jgi:tetratricopeptide (TPR) repeat protein
MKGMLVAMVLGTALMTVGCGASRQSGVCGSMDFPKGSGDAAALDAEGDAAWGERGDEARLRGAIDAWEKALAIDPSNADVRVKLAHAHYFLADGFIRFDETKTEEMLAHFEAGTNQAEIALSQAYPAYRSKYCARQPFSSALQQLDADAVPAMYWYATNLGKYALAKSIVAILNEKDRIKAMMGFIKSNNEKYFYNASDRYFGAFYTKIPFPNGDLPKSRGHFEASIAGSPTYLATKVLYAGMNALKAGDKATFKRMLDEVAAFDLQTAPELIPENTIEKRKGADLLEEIDVYFPED